MNAHGRLEICINPCLFRDIIISQIAFFLLIMLKLIAFILFLSLGTPALAYIGPGAGISVLGSLLGILGTIIVAIGAILFWPIRKMLKRRKAAAANDNEVSD